MPQPLPPQVSPIPDFCSGPYLLRAVGATQLLAMAFALFAPGSLDFIIVRSILLTAYMQTITLLLVAGLCVLRRRVRQPRASFTGALLLLVAVTALVSSVGYSITREIIDPSYLSDETRGRFVLRNVTVGTLAGALMLRYLWTRWAGEQYARTEDEARYQALSARIRPHFLFNSLNSIAALISTKPAAAETMVEDLADLFRAGLAARAQVVPIGDELELVRKFLRIEQTRLGARLGVEWDIPEAVMDLGVPMLTIQPLVENAVHHGVARMVGPATIVVRARLEDELLLLDVENPVLPADPAGHTGSRTAVTNIAQRLRLIYGVRASLELKREADVFRARMRLPALPPTPRGVENQA